jgi:hypothetical protein
LYAFLISPMRATCPTPSHPPWFYYLHNVWPNVQVGKLLIMRRREDNIEMDLCEIGWVGVDWMHLAQDRGQWQALVYTVMNLRVPEKARNFLTSWVTISFSRRTLLPGVLTVENRLVILFLTVIISNSYVTYLAQMFGGQETRSSGGSARGHHSLWHQWRYVLPLQGWQQCAPRNRRITSCMRHDPYFCLMYWFSLLVFKFIHKGRGAYWPAVRLLAC